MEVQCPTKCLVGKVAESLKGIALFPILPSRNGFCTLCSSYIVTGLFLAAELPL
jgi:hypothetical protein